MIIVTTDMLPEIIGHLLLTLQSWYFSDNEGTVLTIEKTDIEMLAKFKSSESVTMRKIKMSRVGFILEFLKNDFLNEIVTFKGFRQLTMKNESKWWIRFGGSKSVGFCIKIYNYL